MVNTSDLEGVRLGVFSLYVALVQVDIINPDFMKVLSSEDEVPLFLEPLLMEGTVPLDVGNMARPFYLYQRAIFQAH